jgi:protein SCO1
MQWTLTLRAALVAALIAALVACGADGPEFQASDITGSSFGRDFQLSDPQGKPRSLADFKGKAVVVFFGYTQCPDVCPTTLAALAETMKRLGPDADRVQVLFITVDPERDTPDVLRSYLGSFDERIVGLTGDPEKIQATVRAYRAFARKVPTKDGDYTMEHTAIVYLMDAENRFVGSFDLNRPPEEAARDWLRHS